MKVYCKISNAAKRSNSKTGAQRFRKGAALYSGNFFKPTQTTKTMKKNFSKTVKVTIKEKEQVVTEEQFNFLCEKKLDQFLSQLRETQLIAAARNAGVEYKKPSDIYKKQKSTTWWASHESYELTKLGRTICSKNVQSIKVEIA